MAELEVDLSDLEVVKEIPKQEVSAIKNQVLAKDAKGNLGITKINADVQEKLKQKAVESAEKVFNTTPESEEFKLIADKISKMGDEQIQHSTKISNGILERRSIRALKNDSDNPESQEIGNTLAKLRDTVTRLDPMAATNKKAFTKRKILGFIPFGFGKKIDNYFQEYKNSQQQIDDIMESLENGAKFLKEENIILDNERKQMLQMINQCEQFVDYLAEFEAQLKSKMESVRHDQLLYDAIETELLYPTIRRQNVLMTHIAVCMTGYFNFQTLIKNNNILAESVKQAKTTTISALRIAITTSETLASQKLVLNQVKSVNDMTSELIKNTSKQLKEQGVEIHKLASDPGVKTEDLKIAFQNVFDAMNAIEKYRKESLPAMEKNIAELRNQVSKAKEYMDDTRQKKVAEVSNEIKNRKPIDDDGVVNI